MKALIVYDSAYGNTARIAHTIARELARSYDTQILQVEEAEDVPLTGIDVLILGSPTQGGRPTSAMQEYIKALPPLKGTQVAAFDTRFALTGHGVALHMLMKTIGFAAEKMADSLVAKGGRAVASPIGFVVREKTGPLEPQEITLARSWADRLVAQALHPI